MNVENKQKLIDAINAQTVKWNDWSWNACFAGMIHKIKGDGEIGSAGVADFLGTTTDQTTDLIYFAGGGRARSISRFLDLDLASQKEVLIGALNSITDNASIVRWDDRV